jgi:DNA-binding transcriptional MerR regulator
MSKSAEAFRTISEVADELDVQKHVLRFWEVKFPQIRPMKRGGGRRYYRPEDMVLLRGIQHLLHAEGYTIKGVQKILREQGIEQVKIYGVEKPASAETGKKAAPDPVKTPAAAGGRIRALPKPVAQPAASNKAAPAATPQRAAIEHAIRELRACRDLLAPPSLKAGKGAPEKTAPERRTRAVRSASR